jgi:hypothetical protein
VSGRDREPTRTPAVSGEDVWFLRQRKHPVCWAIGYRASILPTQVFCERHTNMLQSDTRKLIGKTFRPGRVQSDVFGVHLKRALNEILYYQTEGYRVPQQEDFAW